MDTAKYQRILKARKAELENRRAGNRTVGSNPTSSATTL